MIHRAIAFATASFVKTAKGCNSLDQRRSSGAVFANDDRDRSPKVNFNVMVLKLRQIKRIPRPVCNARIEKEDWSQMSAVPRQPLSNRNAMPGLLHRNVFRLQSFGGPTDRLIRRPLAHEALLATHPFHPRRGTNANVARPEPVTSTNPIIATTSGQSPKISQPT